MRTSLFVLPILLLTLAGISNAQAPAPSPSPERVSANPAKQFTYAYYMYVPPELRTPEARKAKQTILVIPNNSGKVSDDMEFHEAEVLKRVAVSREAASVLKVIVLIPVFPRPESNWQIYTVALDRDSMTTHNKELRRLDRQMIHMIDDARARLKRQGLDVDKKVLLNGFSAQAMFANRFTFLHPDRVKAAAIGSPGGWPIAPVARYKDKSLRYPIGVSDFQQVTGEKLALNKLRKVPLYIFIGDKDENDSVPFGDSYDDEDRELIMPLLGPKPIDRWKISEELYREAGLNATFKVYPGVAHTVSPEMRQDVREFLLKYK
jgi:predicted esterase